MRKWCQRGVREGAPPPPNRHSQWTNLLCRVRKKKRWKVGKLSTSVAEFVRKVIPEVYQKTAGKEPFLRQVNFFVHIKFPKMFSFVGWRLLLNWFCTFLVVLYRKKHIFLLQVWSVMTCICIGSVVRYCDYIDPPTTSSQLFSSPKGGPTFFRFFF